MRCLAAGVVLFIGIVSSVIGAPEPTMTYEQYLTELNSVIQREKTAREEIAKEQALIENLRQQLSQIDLRIAAVIQEKYAILGITEQDVINAENELMSIKGSLEQFILLSPEELIKRKDQISQLETQFTTLKAKNVCLLYRVAARVREVDQVLAQVKSQLEQALSKPKVPVVAASSQYTVGQNGAAKTLWDIALEVYGDRFQWPRIYRANKSLIDKWYAKYKTSSNDPRIVRPQDFVLPGWTLEVPR